MASFLDGVSDFAGSILEKAPAVIDAINAPKVAKAETTKQVTQADQFGRLPGQAGYGTATPPAGVQQTASLFSGLPAWVKPAAIAGGILAGVLILWRLLKR